MMGTDQRQGFLGDSEDAAQFGFCSSASSLCSCAPDRLGWRHTDGDLHIMPPPSPPANSNLAGNVGLTGFCMWIRSPDYGISMYNSPATPLVQSTTAARSPCSCLLQQIFCCLWLAPRLTCLTCAIINRPHDCTPATGEAQEARRDGPQGKGRGPRGQRQGALQIALARIQRLRGPPLQVPPPTSLPVLLEVCVVVGCVALSFHLRHR